MKTEQKIVDMPIPKSAILDSMDANLKAIYAAAKRMGVTA